MEHRLIGIIVQARMGSTRLPGKVMKVISGKPVIQRIIDNLKKVTLCNKIILMTEEGKENNVLKAVAKKNKIGFYVGGKTNVLDNFYNCALKNKLSTIIRITGDCIFIDPVMIDFILRIHFYKRGEYTSNCHPIRIAPKGLDVEVFEFTALKKAKDLVDSALDHCCPVFYKGGFYMVQPFENYSIDTENDFERAEKILNCNPEIT